ncbi:DUF4062 domain-containing protein [Janthinobacterium violaceinigrum]|uniref:DUF4062 domain-containing protein n=1 Tax=Janthinobacterium violaceinigrum TaxID=2654252 RepID=A0A6I1IHV9_9BURK|nr:DUF4062 domain-containing protein [Janthinobacterium violaceinigrum]KAB8066887.1 DUF4062 domain-containing protein [Janthinobacterium violaceinigrum]
MDKRYQVFISSTYSDLTEERKEIMQALLELDAIPAGMELFPAADEDQWTLIKKVIDDCDYYLIVVAGRYGSIGPDKISYTEMEFRYAKESGKPIIGFIHKEPEKIAVGLTESSEEGKAKDDFQTIKIQLRALGLITKSTRSRSVKDTSTYWTLTPYGDNVMLQLRAIRKD